MSWEPSFIVLYSSSKYLYTYSYNLDTLVSSIRWFHSQHRVKKGANMVTPNQKKFKCLPTSIYMFLNRFLDIAFSSHCIQCKNCYLAKGCCQIFFFLINDTVVLVSSQKLKKDGCIFHKFSYNIFSLSFSSKHFLVYIFIFFWSMGYSEVCCFTSKQLNILQLSFYYWFLAYFHWG